MIDLKGINLTGTLNFTQKRARQYFAAETVGQNKSDSDVVWELLERGVLIFHSGYYRATEATLKKLGVIPRKLDLDRVQHDTLSRETRFSKKQLMELLRINKDTAELLIDLYFDHKNASLYRKQSFHESLESGNTEVALW